jgi:hypothetical protein
MTAALGPEAEMERLGGLFSVPGLPDIAADISKARPCRASSFYEIFISQGVDPSGIQTRS